jgi:hypothetical protein
LRSSYQEGSVEIQWSRGERSDRVIKKASPLDNWIPTLPSW